MKKISFIPIRRYGLGKGLLILLIALATLSACEKRYGQADDPVFLKPDATVSNAANEHIFTGVYTAPWWFNRLSENGRQFPVEKDDTSKFKYTLEPNGKIIKTVEGPWYKIEVIDQKNVRFVVKANTTGLQRSVILHTQHYNTFEDLKLVQEP